MLGIYNRKRRSLITNDTEFISSVSILTLLMFAMPPNMQATRAGVLAEKGGMVYGAGNVRLAASVDPKPVCCTLWLYKSQFGHMRSARAAVASPDVRFWLNLCGACASQVCVWVCECVCGTFKICSYRYDCATHRAHKCTRESPEQPEKNAKETKTKMNKNKTKRSAAKIKSSLDLDREWATPDALLKTINRFDIERAAGRLKDTKIHRIALHCIAEQCRAARS